MRDITISRIRRSAPSYLLLVILSLAFLAPFLWAVAASLKPLGEVYRYPPSFAVEQPRWENYPEAVGRLPFFRFLANSLLISTACAIGTVLTAAWAGYGFACLRWRGREFWFWVTLATLPVMPDPMSQLLRVTVPLSR